MRLTPEHLKKVKVCSPLLPPPGPEVVEELLGHIDTLQSDVEVKRKSYEAMSASEFELRQRVVKLESDLAAARSETLAEAAKVVNRILDAREAVGIHPEVEAIKALDTINMSDRAVGGSMKESLELSVMLDEAKVKCSGRCFKPNAYGHEPDCPRAQAGEVMQRVMEILGKMMRHAYSVTCYCANCEDARKLFDQASRQPSQSDHLHEPNEWGVCRICAQRKASATKTFGPHQPGMCGRGGIWITMNMQK